MISIRSQMEPGYDEGVFGPFGTYDRDLDLTRIYSTSLLQWLASVASGLIMAADLLMTVVLICFLRRNHTGVVRCVWIGSELRCSYPLTKPAPSTDSILDILIMYAVSSGE